MVDGHPRWLGASAVPAGTYPQGFWDFWKKAQMRVQWSFCPVWPCILSGNALRVTENTLNLQVCTCRYVPAGTYLQVRAGSDPRPWSPPWPSLTILHNDFWPSGSCAHTHNFWALLVGGCCPPRGSQPDSKPPKRHVPQAKKKKPPANQQPSKLMCVRTRS